MLNAQWSTPTNCQPQAPVHSHNLITKLFGPLIDVNVRKYRSIIGVEMADNTYRPIIELLYSQQHDSFKIASFGPFSPSFDASTLPTSSYPNALHSPPLRFMTARLSMHYQ